MKDFVNYIAKSLVDNPDDVEVEEEVVGNRLIIHLTVSDDDKGKVIGRNGMIANSIRSLLDIAGKKAGVRVSLSIE
ncbi:MAG: RNA-binding protein [Chloroflexi bacterium]|nr:RNA-binding protein [Chloroflexota bacterium]